MPSYEDRMKVEIDHFKDVYKDQRGFKVPVAWDEVEVRFAGLLEKATGVRNLYQYVARHTRDKEEIKVVGLGSGPCGNEIDGIFPELKCKMHLVCVDINPDILETGRKGAEEKGISFEGIVQDVNKLDLEESSCDVIVAYAALHHFMDLDHVAKAINKALKTDGIFTTVDIPTRNGYLMWDDTLETVNNIFKILPPKYRVDHAHFSPPKLVDRIDNIDYSINSFECIRSEDILPALRANLVEVDYVPALTVGRRFFDGIFGPNFNMENPIDKNIFNFIMDLDEYYLTNSILKPETFFGAYKKNG